MSYINNIDILDINWDEKIQNILKKCNLTKENIFKPNEKIILQIKTQNNNLFALLNEATHKKLYIHLDTNNNIKSGHNEFIANIILGYKNIPAHIHYIYDKQNEDTYINESKYDSEDIFYHYDSDGNPDESNDVWEYGDAYHLSDS
jgi:hypothetical protein